MSVSTVKVYAVLIAALAAMGLITSGHLFGIMNSDGALDVLRIGLAAYLIYVGYISREARGAEAALFLVGFLYVGMGVLGLLMPTIGGLLPSGLTGFDVAFHLVTGSLALFVAANKSEHLPAHS